ncbi:MAG TPA: DUF177 domain-containing protein [Anaeromyxobacteraceae bacterium]|nr:DUF177 domain-containing protein [Anaeromyxobacteraceae bacterium]
MRVNIDEIKEGGLNRVWELTREQVDGMVSGDQAGYRSDGPLSVDARFDRVDRRVILRARGTASLKAPCGRCLTSMPVQVPLDFRMTFVPQDQYSAPPSRDEDEARDEAIASFEPTSLDEETYSGKEIDLDPVVREQLILALPPYPVCRDSCKGLCSVCGTNLNEKECGCDRKVPDPRWAGLDKFRNT